MVATDIYLSPFKSPQSLIANVSVMPEIISVSSRNSRYLIEQALRNWKRRIAALISSMRCRESWLGLFEQFFRFDKWNACRVQAAAICDSRLK
jgi:hypothetical protein